jgi:hypothetical protein
MASIRTFSLSVNRVANRESGEELAKDLERSGHQPEELLALERYTT